jgi:hypothetical protein
MEAASFCSGRLSTTDAGKFTGAAANRREGISHFGEGEPEEW